MLNAGNQLLEIVFLLPARQPVAGDSILDLRRLKFQRTRTSENALRWRAMRVLDALHQSVIYRIGDCIMAAVSDLHNPTARLSIEVGNLFSALCHVRINHLRNGHFIP
ncbi:MAG: hypothetical protein R8G34_13760 [Paracoccaceae bacterium]|nr:hypothetical protein [Paracoccaceae bacterium]